MAKPDKVAAVAELKDKFTDSAGAVLTEYRGLSVKALKELRTSLGESASYAVSKNTLTMIAAREAGIDGLDEQLVGPTAIAFIDGDPVVVAKGLRDFARTNPQLVIKGGVVEGKLLGPDDVRKLADLESREVLLSRIAGGMQGVLAQAISLISAPLSQAARLFSALQSAAEENPSLIAGPGEPADDVGESSKADLAAPVDGEVATDAAPAAPSAAGPAADTEQSPSAEAAPADDGLTTEAAPAADDGLTTEAAPAADDGLTTDATPAADQVTIDAAPAADQLTTDAAPAAAETSAADAVEDK
jgi:large subunit ribosomal protein L10